MSFREEVDTMGTVMTPEDAYYGAQTQRAVENFSISGLKFGPSFISALGMIKKHAARVNLELGLLDKERAEAIVASAGEVVAGKLNDQFVVDVFQTGSGTSTNMNANEVIAGRANEILTGKRGGKSPVHPNDHVNMGQSTNDVFPSALHIAALTSIKGKLIPALEKLEEALERKATQFSDIRKIGRTHLQDAVPITLGQEFSGYARQIALGIDRISKVEKSLVELALGGTAVGTGMNARPEFAPRVIALIAKETDLPFREAENHFEAQSAQDAAVEVAAAVKTVAVSLIKIASDIRLLASGPRCAIGEISIPSLQPGSSIMPGKVNPVIPEMVMQAAAQIIGNDATITYGGQGGYLELNTMLPVIAYNLLQSIDLLAGAADGLAEKCVRGIVADRERCLAYIEKSLALCTPLVPIIGYEAAAALAKEAYETGKTVREVAREQRILPQSELDRILDEAIHSKP
ncbi:MAG: class II fumarate hydratase [Deltaproteobacteria bacterium]|nr:class II fumarate hydratase [Deltaproteobacteria bacterium]